jgi:hypothetical protein
MVAGSSSLGSSPPSRQGSCTFPAIWLHSLNLLRSSPLGSGHCFGKTGSSTPNHHSAARSIYGCILAITTTRSPFQPSRVSFTERQVTFRRRDSAPNHEPKLMTRSLNDFLRRFLLHLLPTGFVRIPNFGFSGQPPPLCPTPPCFATLDPYPLRKSRNTGITHSPATAPSWDVFSMWGTYSGQRKTLDRNQPNLEPSAEI